MVEFYNKMYKDIGQEKFVPELLPYRVVGGQFEGSFTNPMMAAANFMTILNHVIPHNKQLKVLFLRIFTQNANGARFSIFQTNPLTAGLTGTPEAFPVVGSVPAGYRDWPFLEAAGAEVLHGNMTQPIHVLEGSIEFRIHGPVAAAANRFGLVWWGVEKDPEEE